MKQQLKRVLIMAGGTGGHVIPGLTLAQAFRARGVEVHWLGTARGLETSLVPEADLPLHLITIEGLRGKNLKTILMGPIKIIQAIWQASQLINAIKPDVILGMGGFASGPGGIAGWLAGCPLVIHEQNARPGMTNRLLAHFAHKVLEAFPATFKPAAKVLTIGNPVRPAITHLKPPTERFKTQQNRSFRLLVLGGSLGAVAINTLLPQALALIQSERRPEVLHQTGKNNYDETEKAYVAAGVTATLRPFINDMDAAYQWADMVICRAGALTIAELCSAGLGAIFIPYPYAVDDHQTANAEFMVKHGAALCCQQKNLTPAHLAVILTELQAQPERRLEMAKAAHLLRQTAVDDKIFAILAEAVRNKYSK